jgi:hypothetical protein
MEGVGSREDTELSGQYLTFSWRELSVKSAGHCQSVGNWMFFPEGSREMENSSPIRFPGTISCQHGVGHLVVRRGIESFGGAG